MPTRTAAMSKKHNTKHQRSGSHYRDRLDARGLTNTPRMGDYKLSDGKPASAKR
jgi:hypothetical protein